MFVAGLGPFCHERVRLGRGSLGQVEREGGRMDGMRQGLDSNEQVVQLIAWLLTMLCHLSRLLTHSAPSPPAPLLLLPAATGPGRHVLPLRPRDRGAPGARRGQRPLQGLWVCGHGDVQHGGQGGGGGGWSGAGGFCGAGHSCCCCCMHVCTCAEEQQRSSRGRKWQPVADYWRCVLSQLHTTLPPPYTSPTYLSN
jgi:hypothetical protein